MGFAWYRTKFYSLTFSRWKLFALWSISQERNRPVCPPLPPEGRKLRVRRIKSQLTGDESSPFSQSMANRGDRYQRHLHAAAAVVVAPVTFPHTFLNIKTISIPRTENRCNDQLCSWRETVRHDQVALYAFAFKHDATHRRFFILKIGIYKIFEVNEIKFKRVDENHI